MTFIDTNTPRQDLECVILDNDGLYRRFDEKKLLNAEYTDEELRNEIIEWIAEGDECGAC